MKTVVITGIRGFIAAALAARFRDEGGWRVVGTDRSDSPRIRDVLRDACPDLVLHAAAELYDAASMFESNVLLTHMILEHCRDVAPRCRLVALGSSSEYGRRDHPTRETDALQPGTIYEGTKAAAAMLVQASSLTYGFQAAVVRPYSVYGIGERPGRFLPFLLSRPPSIKLCPGAAHDFVYIDDFVAGVFAVLARQSETFDTVNIGTGTMTTNAQLVAVFERVLGHTYVIEAILPPKANDAETWVCDPGHLEREYGYKPCTTLEQGITLMAAAAVANNHPAS